MSYKASVSNIYELLNEDGEEGRRQTPQVNVGGDDKTAVKKTTLAPAKAQPKTKVESPKVDRPSQPKGRQEDRRPRDVAPKAGEGEEIVAGKQQRRRDNREGAERGAGRGTFVPRGNKRPFDRRSGTGRGKENKKGGAGKGNWGTLADDQVAQAEGGQKQEEKTETVEVQPQEEGAQPAAQAEAQPATTEHKEPEEEEDKTLTLEEYLKAKKGLKVDLPKARQSGEGVADSQWAGFVELKKKDEETLAKKEEKKREAAAKKDVVPVNEVFKIQEEVPSYQKKGRRDNGAERGGRGGASKRGGKRGGSGKPAPNVNDESSFPALATKA